MTSRVHPFNKSLDGMQRPEQPASVDAKTRHQPEWTLTILDEPDYLDGILSKYDIRSESEWGPAPVAYAFREEEARLIAAAPRLLFALKNLLAVKRGEGGTTYYSDEIVEAVIVFVEGHS